MSDGLVNGARGEVVHIVTNDNNDVTTVLVKFDCGKVGHKAHQASRFSAMYPNAVPVTKVEVVFLARGKRGTEQYSFLYSIMITVVHITYIDLHLFATKVHMVYQCCSVSSRLIH